METELKLAIDARHVPRLRRQPLLAGTKPAGRVLHSVYYDTPDFALLRRRIAFRLRRLGHHWVQTLKAEAPVVGALSSRPEWELPVAGRGPDPAVLPDDALRLLQGIDAAELTPVFVTEFRRTTWRLQDERGSAELALDQGVIRAAAGEPPAGSTPGRSEQVEKPATVPICEIEIELQGGAPELLFTWAQALLEGVPLRIEPRSKAERGYALCGAVRPAPVRAARPALHGGQTAAQAWAEIVRAALAQLVANVPGFLEDADDIEYLHQLRIALRRLRGAVALATAAGRARPAWAAGLAEIMQSLNPARDWDVFLVETLPALRPILGEPPVPAAHLARLAAAAAQARTAAQAGIAAPAFTGLVLAVGRDLFAADAADTPAREWARHILAKRWKALRREGGRFEDLDAAGRHRLRIAAKKLRYAADALEPLYGKRTGAFIRRLAELQDRLGRANDAVVAEHLLHAVGWEDSDTAYAAGRVSGALRARAGEHQAGDAAAWRRLMQTPRFW